MANINPRGIDLTTGQMRRLTSSDTLTDDDGGPLPSYMEARVTRRTATTGHVAWTLFFSNSAGVVQYTLSGVGAIAPTWANSLIIKTTGEEPDGALGTMTAHQLLIRKA
jgi:hypothetical protein